MITIDFLLLALLATLVHKPCAELSTEPKDLAVKPGEEAELKCLWSSENSTKLALLRWSRLPEATPAGLVDPSDPDASLNATETYLKNSSRVTIQQGVLTIQNISMADAGEYRCHDESGSAPAQSRLIVYDMPSYAQEAIIITGMTLALLLVLAAGLGLKARREKQNRQREKTGYTRPHLL